MRSTSNELYIGQTNNLTQRVQEHVHKTSKAAKFTKDGKEFQLVYSEEYTTRFEAMRRENQLKGWTRMKKEALIKGDFILLKRL